MQATDHQTRSLGDRDRDNLCVTSCQKIKQIGQNGLEGFTGRSSSSTDVSPADVEKPPSALLLAAHVPAKPTSNRGGSKTICSLIFRTDPNCEVRRRTKVTRAPCTRSPHVRADRINIAARYGDMRTADHNVLNEDQESRMHHKCAVVVQDLASKLSMENQISPGEVEKSSKNLTPLRKSEIHLYEQSHGIYEKLATS